MEAILAHAQGLVYTLAHLMPTAYQSDSLHVMLGLFLQGQRLPQHASAKSPSALSRFLNHYPWPTRQVIRKTRAAVLEQLCAYSPRGRRPHLQVIIDLTTLEKRGKFKAFAHLVSVFHGKRGVHLVVLYLVVGPWRIPWNFRLYRGKETTTPAQLGLRLVRHLPAALTQRFHVLVLADTAFGSTEFLTGIRNLKHHAIVGVRCDRTLKDGRCLQHLHKPGQRVRLKGCPVPVTIAWFYLERDGKRLKRFVLSTRVMKASTLKWWGKRRWQIEGFFKTAKHRFGLHRFAQKSQQGLYRWLILSLIAFLLAHWVYLSSGSSAPPDWGQAAQLALDSLLPQVVAVLLLLEIIDKRSLLRSQGFEVHLSCCKM